MAKLAKLLQAAAGVGGAEALNVEDVFSTDLVELTASTSYGAVTNNIDLSGEGGLVWEKARNITQVHRLYDTERGATKFLKSDSTAAEVTATTTLTSFNSDGFTLDYSFYGSNTSECFWTFRKAPKFFDVVTWTGDGTDNRAIPHNLGTTVGSYFVKCTSDSSASDWIIWHKDLTANNNNLVLNTTAAEASYNLFSTTAPDSSNIYLGTNFKNYYNLSGRTYVAYLFAHNDGDGEFGPDGDADIIKCGSYTGANPATIDLGFEPQWIMIKRSSGTGDWVMFDAMRGLVVEGNDAYLYANTSGAEVSNTRISITPTGFVTDTTDYRISSNGETYIYIAIRRGPMAVPTDATDVFAVTTRDATPPAFNTSFDVDMAIYQSNVTSPDDIFNSARLMQGDVLRTNTTDNAISGGTGFVFDYSNGWYGPTQANSNAYAWMWGRAPNFFDVVCNTAVASSDLRINHNLGVEPEMIWTKQRDAPTYTDGWYCYHKDIGTTGYIRLDSSAAKNSVVTLFNSPSSTDFGLDVNAVWDAGTEFVHYLFASLAGISKVGSYTGNGSSQTIDCGFSSGARLVIIKGLTVATPWLLYDSARGIVSGNDPYITLNAKSGSSTTDYIDPDSSGFIVNNNVWVNNSGSDYIFYAIA